MFDRESRYRDARPFTPARPGAAPFGGVRPRAVRYAAGVIEHQVRAGDRLDLLARHYYNNDRLWWLIVDANPEFLYGGDVMRDDMLGRTILIPRIAR
jgi:nucleoid-associated protein YgaU